LKPGFGLRPLYWSKHQIYTFGGSALRRTTGNKPSVGGWFVRGVEFDQQKGEQNYRKKAQNDYED
jgi:hypothetical protein